MSIKSLTQDIFAENGPLHQVMQRTDPNAKWREEQSEAAIAYAEQLDLSFGQTAVKPLVRQIAPGVGKTLSYLIPTMLAFVIYGRKTVISTFTTELRDSIKDKDTDVAIESIRIYLDNSNQSERLHELAKISVEIRESATSFASISVAARQLREATLAQKAAAEAYFDWCVDELLNHNFPRLSTWTGILGNKLISDDVDYSLTYEEQSGKLLDTIAKYLVQPLLDEYCLKRGIPAGIDAATITKIPAKAFKDNNSRSGKVGQANIILVTHAMFLMNNVHFGDVLHTTKENKNNTKGFNIILDEAEMLAGQASEWTKFKISKSEIEDALVMLDSGAPAEVAKGRIFLNDLEKIVFDYHNVPRRAAISRPTNSPRNIEILEDDQPRSNLSDALKFVYDALYQAYYKCMVSLPLNDFQHVDTVMGYIHGIIGVIDDATGSSSQAALIKGTKTKPVTEIDKDNDSFVIRTCPLHNNYLASWAWRNAVQYVEHVYALSATLVGGNVEGKPSKSNPYEIFNKRIGIKTSNSLPAISAPTHGGLSRLVLTAANIERDKDPSIYAQHVVNSLILADKTNLKKGLPERSLVLFPSKVLLDETLDLLEHQAPSIARRVYKGKISSELTKFAGDSKGIWFGHNWQGTNFVNSSGVTLLGRILIAKAPVTPSSIVKEKYDYKEHLNDNMDDAAMKIIQGAGRGMRNPNDKPELWLLDPYIFHLRVQKKFGGKGGSAQQWKTMLDGLPSHWTRQATLHAIDNQYNLQSL